MFIFDESINTLQSRCTGLGIELRKHVESGRVTIQQVDPAELSPGEFAQAIRGRQAPRVDADQATATMELINWAYDQRGCARGQVQGSVPLAADRPALPPARAVVTGGTGFVGSKLVERLSELGFEDVVLPVRSYRSGVNVCRSRASGASRSHTFRSAAVSPDGSGIDPVSTGAAPPSNTGGTTVSFGFLPAPARRPPLPIA